MKIEIVAHTNKYAFNSRRGRAYKRKFRNLANKIEAFEAFIGEKLYTDSFTYSIVEEFVYFLKHSFPYRPSTISGFLAHLGVVISRAQDLGYKVEKGFRDFSIPAEESTAVYLSENEIEVLFNLKNLSKEMYAVRERFVIGCCSGLRFSDYSVLTKQDLSEIISVKTKKTGAVVLIPRHWMITDIMNRNEELPMLASSQAFNACLKRLCKRAKLNEKVVIERTEGFKVVKKRVEKYKLISSHTARRSFATNMYLNGVATFKIMRITGHSTEESFFKYIRITQRENAEELLNHPFFMREHKKS